MRGAGVSGSARPAHRVLVVGPAWIGDMVMTGSLYRTLRDRRPAARIDVLAPEWSLDVVSRMPGVDDAIRLPAGHGELRLRARWRIARRLRKRGYDRAIVTRRSFKSALIPWMARIPRRTGFLGEMRFGVLNDIRPLDGEAMPTLAQRYAALGLDEPGTVPAGAVPRPRLAVDRNRQRELVRVLRLEGTGRVAGLAPGAAHGPSKRWPVERWRELAARLTARDWRVWIFGGPGERALGRRVREGAAPPVRDLTGRTSIPDAIDLMALCRTVVANDTGLLHIASALDTRVVGLFGSTTPRRAPPLTDRRAVFWLGLDCSPCFERECPLRHRACLRRIDAGAVARAVTEPGAEAEQPRVSGLAGGRSRQRMVGG